MGRDRTGNPDVVGSFSLVLSMDRGHTKSIRLTEYVGVF